MKYQKQYVIYQLRYHLLHATKTAKISGRPVLENVVISVSQHDIFESYRDLTVPPIQADTVMKTLSVLKLYILRRGTISPCFLKDEEIDVPSANAFFYLHVRLGNMDEIMPFIETLIFHDAPIYRLKEKLFITTKQAHNGKSVMKFSMQAPLYAISHLASIRKDHFSELEIKNVRVLFDFYFTMKEGSIRGLNCIRPTRNYRRERRRRREKKELFRFRTTSG